MDNTFRYIYIPIVRYITGRLAIRKSTEETMYLILGLLMVTCWILSILSLISLILSM